MAAEHEILAGLQARGVPLHVAQGIVTGMRAESGLNPGINEIKPVVPGSRGGYGLNQWTGPRRVAYETFAKERGLPLDSLDAQLDFTMHEFKGPESRAWAALQGAQTPEEAAKLYETQFLRPGIPHGGRGRETLSTSGLLNEAPQMDEPQQGPLGGLLGIKRDTSKINDLGLALMALSSPRAAPAFMQMAQGRREEAAGRRKEREEAGRANRTVEWLAQQPGGQQFAALAEALGPQAAVQAYMQAQKTAADAAGGVEYGLTPQYGVDAEGNPVLIQIGKNGTATQTALPEGVTFQKEPIRIDAGTHWVLLDPITRQPVGQVEKDSRGDARNTAIGKAEGEAAGTAITGAPQAIAKADQSIELIDSILADPALPGITGMVQGRLPPMTQAGTDLGVKIEQLQSRVFLEAFETLKGAGQITEREGAAAQAALARLNRAQSTEEYKAALTELRGIITGATDRIRGAAGAAAPAAGPADNDPLGLRK